MLWTLNTDQIQTQPTLGESFEKSGKPGMPQPNPPLNLYQAYSLDDFSAPRQDPALYHGTQANGVQHREYMPLLPALPPNPYPMVFQHHLMPQDPHMAARSHHPSHDGFLLQQPAGSIPPHILQGYREGFEQAALQRFDHYTSPAAPESSPQKQQHGKDNEPSPLRNQMNTPNGGNRLSHAAGPGQGIEPNALLNSSNTAAVIQPYSRMPQKRKRRSGLGKGIEDFDFDEFVSIPETPVG